MSDAISTLCSISENDEHSKCLEKIEFVTVQTFESVCFQRLISIASERVLHAHNKFELAFIWCLNKPYQFDLFMRSMICKQQITTKIMWK